MASQNGSPLTAAEWKIMKAVWKRKSCAARDVYDDVAVESGWAVNTVRTLLARLVEKGYLKTTRVGNSFLYRPTRPPLKSLLNMADTLLDNVLEDMAEPLLAHMVKKMPLSPEMVARLRSLLDNCEDPKDPR